MLTGVSALSNMSGLPEDLVTNRPSISGQMERMDGVAVEDVIQLWKVYSTSKAVLAGEVGRRLENFFWRIWGNPRILDHLRGSQVAVLFNNICERRLTPITPMHIPHPSGNFGVQGQKRGDSLGLTHSRNVHATSPQSQSRQNSKDTLDTPTLQYPQDSMATAKSQRSKTKPNTPPSILKKSRTDSSSQLYKNDRIKSPNLDSAWQSTSDGEEAVLPYMSPFSDATITMRVEETLCHEQKASARIKKKPSMNRLKLKTLPSDPITGTDKNPNSQGVGCQKIARKKPAIHTKAGASIRKATMTRRKSSQTSSSGASGLVSPPASSRAVNARSEPTDNLGLEILFRRKVQSARSSRTVSPRPLKHSARITGENLSSSYEEEAPTGNSDHNLENGLVDPDFRFKFASRVRPEARPLLGSPNPLEQLAAHASEAPRPYQGPSIIRFEEAIHGDGKGKLIAGFKNLSRVPSNPTINLAPANEDDGIASVLPRTKSQLTLLLRRGQPTEGEN